MALTNACAVSVEKQLPINAVNNMFSFSPTKGSLIKKQYTQGKLQSCHKSHMSTLGLRYFCHTIFQHLLISQSEETSGAEDMPALWKFLPKIATAEQTAGPTEGDDGQNSGFCVAGQLSLVIGIFSMFKSFLGPTADFPLYHALPSFLVSQGVAATSFTSDFFW